MPQGFSGQRLPRSGQSKAVFANRKGSIPRNLATRPSRQQIDDLARDFAPRRPPEQPVESARPDLESAPVSAAVPAVEPLVPAESKQRRPSFWQRLTGRSRRSEPAQAEPDPPAGNHTAHDEPEPIAMLPEPEPEPDYEAEPEERAAVS